MLIFKKTDKNMPRYKETLILCNEEVHKNFNLILIVCQRQRQSEKTKTGKTFDLDVILTCGFLQKSYFLRVF